MMPYWITILTSIGTSIITCIGMEAYHQRRAQEEMGQYEKGLE